MVPRMRPRRRDNVPGLASRSRFWWTAAGQSGHGANVHANRATRLSRSDCRSWCRSRADIVHIEGKRATGFSAALAASQYLAVVINPALKSAGRPCAGCACPSASEDQCPPASGCGEREQTYSRVEPPLYFGAILQRRASVCELWRGPSARRRALALYAALLVASTPLNVACSSSPQI